MKNNNGITRRYKLRAHAAMDAIESRFTYNEFADFMNILIDLLNHERLSSLGLSDINNIGKFIQIMCDLVESKELDYLLERYNLGTYPRSEFEIRVYKKDNLENRIDVFTDQIQDWLNALPEDRYNDNIFLLVQEFFTSDLFFGELVNWINQVIVDEHNTISQLLESYYAWFPYFPYLKTR